jgi:type IV pilus assembly protein PilN
MRITLNLATRPFADLAPALKRLRISMGILAVIAIALVLGLRAVHHKAEEARQREHSLDGQIASINQERQGYQAMMQRPDNAQLLTQADALNKLFNQKAFSWTLAMENLETVLPGGVQVASIEPTPNKDGHITLQLRVIGPHDRSVELLRNLEHSRRFFQPRIVGETSETGNNANQRLEPVSTSNRYTFDLQVEYNPPSLGEKRPEPSPMKAPATRSEDNHAQPPDSSPTPGFAQQRARKPYAGPVNPAVPGDRPSSRGPQPNPLQPNPAQPKPPQPKPGGPQ